MSGNKNPDRLPEILSKALQAAGVSPDQLCCADENGMKVVVIASELRDSLNEIQGSPRENVVMVRIDDRSLDAIDEWITAGVAKSRSEAAALFIKEGLAVRAEELMQLQDAIRDVQEAKRKLEERMAKVVGKTD